MRYVVSMFGMLVQKMCWPLQERTTDDTLALVFGKAATAQRLGAQAGTVSVVGSISPPAPDAALRSNQPRQLIYVRGHPVAATQIGKLVARLQVKGCRLSDSPFANGQACCSAAEPVKL